MRWTSRRFAYVCGFLGVAVAAAGVGVAAAVYRGQDAEPYSPENHFISELGRVGVSQAAVAFNGSMIVAGLLQAGFMLGLGRHLGSRWARVASGFGLVSALSGTGIGLVPMNHLDAHVAVAFCLFYSAPLAIGTFTVAIHADRTERLSRWLDLPAAVAVLSLALFDAIPILTRVSHVELLTLQRFPRPHVWPAAMLEWWVFVSVLAWIASTSADLAIRERSERLRRAEST